MTTMIYFDTLHYVKTLKSAGFSDAQAEAFARAQQDALSECLDTTLATKSDVLELKNRMDKIEYEIKLLRWMIGIVIAGVGALVLKTFF